LVFVLESINEIQRDEFEIFNTDGKEASNNWPQENKGVFDWIVKLRRKDA